ARFDGRDYLLAPAGGARQTANVVANHAGLNAAKPAARRGDKRGDDIVTEARTQRRTQVADAIGEAELDRPTASPVFAGEQGFFWTLEPRPAASFHELDEVLVDVALQRLKPLDVLGVLRKEWIEHGLVLAGNIKPAFDTNPAHQLGKTERPTDNADGADDRGRIAENFVGGASDHIPAGGRDILGKGDHRARILGGELADAAIDQVRLHRRAAGPSDQQRERSSRPHAEGPFERT